MKYLEDLRDKYKGKEIWVIGGGPSLDEYPIDFFKDKICIGMNWVFSVFLDVGDGVEKFSTRAFYSVHEHRESADWIAEHIPHFLNNCFFLLPPSRIQIGRSRMVWWEDYNKDPYYMRWGPKGISGVRGVQALHQDFIDMVKCIMDKGECHYVCRGTTLHWAMEVAVVLGAKKIYLVGAEARWAGNAHHMYKHGSFYAKLNQAAHGFIRAWHDGTRSLAMVLQPYGVDVVYYYYGKGEQAP